LIVLYNSNETGFVSNGVCILDNVLYSKPSIVEELNGDYTLELSVSIANNDKHNLIQKDMIIKADDNLFRIQERKKNFNSIYIFARQLFWDLLDNFIEDIRPTNTTASGALESILSHTESPHSFSGYSDVATTGTANYVRMSPLDAIMIGASSSSLSAKSSNSSDNALLDIWGGELELDKYNIKILQHRGEDRGTVIAYGKNLTGIEEDLNTKDTKTRIMPTGLDESNNIIMLPEKYIDSQYINNYPHPKYGTLAVEGAQVSADNGITLNDVYTMLRNAVSKEYASGIDLPTYSYTINFIDLRNTEEYKNYAVLESVYMGDTVTIKHEKLGMNLKARVVKTTKEYNAAKGIWAYKEIELGQASKSLTQQNSSQISEVASTIVQKESALQIAIKHATELITGNRGGHVILHKNANGEPYEILIMDTEDINTAQKVWRWNEGGLGYSGTGYNGPYGTAITSDGKINADFIITGKLNAAIISGGVISAADGSFSLNLNSGHLSFNNGKKALDLYNNSLDFHDWTGNAELVGSISSTRETDASGNPTGTPGISIGVPDSCALSLGKLTIESNGGYVFSNDIKLDYSDSNNPRLRINRAINANGSDTYSGILTMLTGDNKTVKITIANGFVIGVDIT
jgi:phage minor structural protein